MLSDNYTQDPAPPHSVGVPALIYGTIKAVASGSQQVKGIYRRFWEDTTGTEESFTLNITVVSQNITSWNWDFGDGIISTEQNPMHTFPAPGNYIVTLTVSDENGKNSTSVTVDALEQQVPAYTIDKTVMDVAGKGPSGSVTKAGDVISYQVKVPNDGNIDLTNVRVTDSLINITKPIESKAHDGILEVGEIWTYSENYMVTQADINNNGSKDGVIRSTSTVYSDQVGPKSDTVDVPIHTGEVTYAYITNEYGNTVSVIDTAINKVTATVNVGSNPKGIAASRDGAKVYVANYYGGTVSVIDTATNTVTSRVNVGNNPNGIAVSPDGKKVYVTNLHSVTVSVIDTATNSVIATVIAGSAPRGIAVNPDGKKVYVTNSYTGAISVIDTTTNNVTDVGVGVEPYGIAVNPEGTKVYVTNEGDYPDFNGTVDIIDVASNYVTARVLVGSNPRGIAISPDGTKIYVANKGNNNVSVIDTTINYVVATVNVGISPGGVAVSPDGRKVYVANEGSNNVSVIDSAANTVTATVNIGNGPAGIALGQSNVSSSGLKQTLNVNFNCNVTNGYIPLTVQFTDLSENATRWNWDFGDETTSTEKNPEHTYFSEGSYSVNLTASNENDTGSKSATITALSYSNSDGGSSSGGGGGGSSEPQSNVETKELSQSFITNGNPVKFEFPENVTSVIYVSFDSKKTAGKTTAIVEMLKAKSALVSDPPSGEVYKYINIWIGSSGFATPKNIENAIVCFKVEKSWIRDSKIDKSSIYLNRHNDGKWNTLPTNISGEDNNYLYFIAQTPGFSPFAITWKAEVTEIETQPAAVSETQNKLANGNGARNTEQTPEEMQSTKTTGKESIKTPGFGLFYGIISLLAAFPYKRE